MKKIISTLLVSLLILLPISSSYAASTTPDIMMYEGKLLDTNGAAVTTEHSLRISFWTNADYITGDVALGVIDSGAANYGGWQEVQTITPNSNGIFSVELGSETSLPTIDFDSHKYLQVEIKASADAITEYELLDSDSSSDTIDRQTIGSLPYSKNSEAVGGKSVGTSEDELAVLGTNGKWTVGQMPSGTNEDSFTINADGDDAIVQFGQNDDGKITYSDTEDTFDLDGNRIVNVDDPTDNQDVATKAYVDAIDTHTQNTDTGTTEGSFIVNSDDADTTTTLQFGSTLNQAISWISTTDVFSIGTDGSGSDVVFYSDTTGDNMAWSDGDAKLSITGGDGNTALHITEGNADFDGALDVDGSMTIGGDLIVNGNTTVLNTITMEVEDPLQILGADNPADIIDVGFLGEYNNGAEQKFSGLIRDATDKDFKLIEEQTHIPSSSNTVDFSSVDYADLNLENLNVTGDLTLTGTVNSKNTSDIHSQNTDTGTTSTDFKVNSGADTTGTITFGSTLGAQLSYNPAGDGLFSFNKDVYINGDLEVLGEIILDETFTNSGGDDVVEVLEDLDATIGDRTYTEDNYVSDGETLTSSINTLDQQLKDIDDINADQSSAIDDLQTGVTGDSFQLNSDGIEEGGAITFGDSGSTLYGNIYGFYFTNNIGVEGGIQVYGIPSNPEEGGMCEVDGNCDEGQVCVDFQCVNESEELTEFITLIDDANMDSVQISTGLEDPDGNITAEAGSLLLGQSGKLYINTDGETAWNEVKQDVEESGITEGLYLRENDVVDMNVIYSSGTVKDSSGDRYHTSSGDMLTVTAAGAGNAKLAIVEKDLSSDEGSVLKYGTEVGAGAANIGFGASPTTSFDVMNRNHYIVAYKYINGSGADYLLKNVTITATPELEASTANFVLYSASDNGGSPDWAGKTSHGSIGFSGASPTQIWESIDVNIATGTSIWLIVDWSDPSNWDRAYSLKYDKTGSGASLASGFTTSAKYSSNSGSTWLESAVMENGTWPLVTGTAGDPAFPDITSGYIKVGEIGSVGTPIDENTTAITTGTPGANQVQLVPVHTNRLD